MHWELYCRVIDNFGDIGVCWRLAADLASRGHRVTLVVDDASALAWMAPEGAPGVAVLPWGLADAQAIETADGLPGRWPGDVDVVVEAFGCELPDATLSRMERMPVRPVWINLEYLSAEADVERSHGLQSPRFAAPGTGLVKWFFYPGFTARTGGLLREPGLLRERAAFDRAAWLREQGVERRDSELIVSVFAYQTTALPGLLRSMSSSPKLLLVAQGLKANAEAALAESSSGEAHPDNVRLVELPWLTQSGFDRLLWSADLNLVRGEDSFVRAQWAGAPFIWQIYPQHDGVHRLKLEAFLERFLEGAPLEMRAAVRNSWWQWNGFEPASGASPLRSLPLQPWLTWCRQWRDRLSDQSDLASQLIEFVAERR